MALMPVGQEREQLAGILGVVEDQQPVPAAPQFLAQRGNGLVVFLRRQAQPSGELGKVATHRGGILGAYPPHQVVLGRVPPGVLDRQPGLAQTAQAGDDLDSGRGAFGAERAVKRLKLVMPSGEVGVRPVSAQFPRLGGVTAFSLRRRRFPGFHKRLVKLGLELLRVRDLANDEVGIAQPFPEGLLPAPPIRFFVVQ